MDVRGTCHWGCLVYLEIIAASDLSRLVLTFRAAYASGPDRLKRSYAGIELWAMEAPYGDTCVEYCLLKVPQHSWQLRKPGVKIFPGHAG